MKSRTVLAMALVVGFFLTSATLPSPRLNKAFEALRIFDYFKAKELFYKSLKRDSVPAAFGLSLIYSRNDNPFTDIDSAHKYIRIAERNLPLLEENDRLEYAKLGVGDSSIAAQGLTIDTLAFLRAERLNDVASWNDFIDGIDPETLKDTAIMRRNELAFTLAENSDRAEDYLLFMTTYPEASQFTKAKERYEFLLFKENTVEGDAGSFRDFAKHYPHSPYAREALNEVYALETENGTLNEYLAFVTDYPDNPNTSEAWRKIYALEVDEVSARGIAEFTLKYPEYPFMEELRQEFDLAVTRYYPFEENSLWGFINEKGEVSIEPVYEWVEEFSDGFALVGTDDGVGYIDKSGILLNQSLFDDAYPFSSGFGVVEVEGYLGVINRLGEWVINAEYDDIGEPSEGFFYAEKDGLFGYLDYSGDVAIPFQFDNATDFQSGVAVVDSAGKRGLISSQGTMLTKFEFDWIEGFSKSAVPSRFRKDRLFGLLDSSGRVLADTLYEALGEFHENLALAGMDGKYGFISVDGDTIIDFKYDFSDLALAGSFFQSGHAKVFQKDKVGMIDTTGRKVFPAIFEDMGAYSTAPVPVKKRGKWGYADLAVDLVIPYQFDLAETFQDSMAIVSKEGFFGVIDTLGQVKVPFKYTDLRLLDTLVIAADTTYGLISLKGDTLVPLIYEAAEVVDEKVVRFKTKSGQVHYYDYRQLKFIRREENP